MDAAYQGYTRVHGSTLSAQCPMGLIGVNVSRGYISNYIVGSRSASVHRWG